VGPARERTGHRVTDRIRTGDLQGHDLALSRLSYSHSVAGWARTTGLRLIRAALRPAELRRRKMVKRAVTGTRTRDLDVGDVAL
jgi:hypothetical protein